MAAWVLDSSRPYWALRAAIRWRPMRITIQTFRPLRVLLAYLEHGRRWILGCLAVALILQSSIPTLLWGISFWPWVSVIGRAHLFSEAALLGLLAIQMRKRDSLRWQASERAKLLAGPVTIDFQDVFAGLRKVLFCRRAESVLAVGALGLIWIFAFRPFAGLPSSERKELAVAIS